MSERDQASQAVEPTARLKLLVVGAGAVGGYFGGRLAQAGRDVTFLLRPARRDTLARDGLRLRSPHGDATVHPRAITAAELRSSGEHFDVVVIATKAYSLAGAMDDVAPAVGEGTLVLPLLNGMRQLDDLRARFGDRGVLGGSVRIIADLDDDGSVRQMTQLGELNYGALPTSGVDADRLAELHRTFTVPGVDNCLRDDILATMWAKWSIVGSMGIVCLLAGGTLGEAASVPHGAEQAGHVLDECLAVTRANGYTPDAELFTRHRALLTDPHSTLTSSLYRDMTRGLPVEADHLLGDFVARAHGVPVPLMTAAYVRLKVYEAARG